MKSTPHIKSSFLFTLALFVFFHIPFMAHAASISLSPSQVTIHKGESFTISVGVSGANDVSTVQMNANFTPGTLRFTSWSANDSWMSLKTSDADSSSNTAGTVLKTSGFPGGFSGSKNFGTMRFTGAQEGTATISLSPSSFIYDSANNNTYAGGNTVSVTVLPDAVKQPTKTEPTTPVKEPVKEIPVDNGVDHTFDIAVELPKVNLEIGEDLKATIHITNLSSKIENMQIPITYQVFDVNGALVNESTSLTQLKTVNTKFEHTFTTNNLPGGLYNLRAEVAFENLTNPAVSQAGFNIQTITETKDSHNKFIIIIVVLLGMLIALSLFTFGVQKKGKKGKK